MKKVIATAISNIQTQLKSIKNLALLKILFSQFISKRQYFHADKVDKLLKGLFFPVKIGDDERDLVFAIKIYRKSSINPRGGRFTCMLDKLRKGDMIKSYGPVSHMDYLGKAYVDVKGQRCSLNRLVMIVGGSGITPMINLLDTFLPRGHEVCLFSCNRTEDDIIYKTKLNSYAKQYSNFSLHYIIEIVPVTAQYR